MNTTPINHQSAFIIADCHLPAETNKSATNANLNHLFIKTIRDLQESNIEACFILGDLFEYWIGDDDGLVQYPKVIASLQQLSASGKKIYFQLGNRDFLVGKEFCQQVKATLLPETQIVKIGNFTLHLSHGDELCTKDIEYQKFKKITRNPEWIKNALNLPIEIRRQEALKMRQASSNRQQSLQNNEQYEITDIDESSFQKCIAANPNVDFFIHGHTHKSMIHEYPTTKRWVLGDWRNKVGECIYVHKSTITMSKQIPK